MIPEDKPQQYRLKPLLMDVTSHNVPLGLNWTTISMNKCRLLVYLDGAQPPTC